MNREEIEDLANRGDVRAQVYLGYGFSKHGTLGRDETKAEMWLRKAAEAGDRDGQRRLCRFLYDRQSVEAVVLAKRLAEQDDIYGWYILGHLTVHGDLGVMKNKSEGIRLLAIAASKGHIVSQIDLLRFSNVLGFMNPITLFRALPLFARLFAIMKQSPNSDKVLR